MLSLLRNLVVHLGRNQKIIREEKATQKTKLFGPDIFGWGGVSHAKGWGPKSSVCPSKPRETNFWAGYPGTFARDVPRAPEKFEKKRVCVQFSLPRTCSLVFVCHFSSIIASLIPASGEIRITLPLPSPVLFLELADPFWGKGTSSTCFCPS